MRCCNQIGSFFFRGFNSFEEANVLLFPLSLLVAYILRAVCADMDKKIGVQKERLRLIKNGFLRIKEIIPCFERIKEITYFICLKKMQKENESNEPSTHEWTGEERIERWKRRKG